MNLDMEVTILCALDYALPRETYAGQCVRDTIKKQWANFPRECSKPLIFRPVVQALHEGRAGADMDRREWFAFLRWVRDNMTPAEFDRALRDVRYLRPCVPEVEAFLNEVAP